MKRDHSKLICYIGELAALFTGTTKLLRMSSIADTARLIGSDGDQGV